MAIHPTRSTLAVRREPVDIAEWTARTADELASLSLAQPSERPIRGTTVTLDISLDDETPARRPVRTTFANAPVTKSEGADGGVRLHGDASATPPRRREPLRRDSLKRREALLKGKEGSRRRQRWENDQLLHNPHLQPPLPSDWEVHPTHPVRNVPYDAAQYWEAGMKARYLERTSKAKTGAASSLADQGMKSAPKELREKLKRARGAKALLVDLEIQVRRFVEQWHRREEEARRRANLPDSDSEEDEVVFVGRNGEMSDMPRSPRRSEDEVESERLVFDSLETDHGASFGRWLVHSIGQYYGLNTWSKTVGDPARREAYVGIKEGRFKSGRMSAPSPLPHPLYGLV